MTILVISLVKVLSFVSRLLGLGHGSTWPGHIALTLFPNIIETIMNSSTCKTVIVTGTNGKTTTSLMLKHILRSESYKVFHNESGANLKNGIASTILLNSTLTGKLLYDVAVFEVDENAVPSILAEMKPDIFVVLNLFRDQLDRYGEVFNIAAKWQKALGLTGKQTTIILNEDDPEVSYLAKFSKGNVFRFGLPGGKEAREDATADSTSCPKCQTQLIYTTRVYSHLGKWKCPECHLFHKNPDITQVSYYPLSGTYNRYNTLAAVLTAEKLGVQRKTSLTALKSFKPAFGRQESISYKNKKIQIFLSKNPAGFNQSLETILNKHPKSLLFVLNDRIPDGRDVSWIWDTDIERFSFKNVNVTATGDRAYDMGLRLKYAGVTASTVPSLEEAIQTSLKTISAHDILYVIPTYSGMLETRKVITGRKIL